MDGKENSILLALRQIISAVSLKSSFEEAIASLVEKIRSTMHTDCCSLYLLNARKTVLSLAATDGLSKESIGKASLQLGEGLVGLVGQKEELINLADAPSH
ncbi:MAG TPA: phosphoenolpyruvate-protein phosphotransferase PtsP, partial [Succinivibrio sp.]|nr:phosphoenolpyruvate-protein phosphotransferase PtsP [Succinivibrio sp.]